MTTPLSLDILYQDEHVIAVNKPAGMLVHRSRIDRQATRFVLQTLRDQIGQHVYPVHRLDKPTSGALLLALNQEAAQRLTDTFAQRQVAKTYLAVVRGYTEEEDCIDYPLKEMLDRVADRQAQADKDPQKAITCYQRLACVELPYPVTRYPTSRYSLITAHPKTGRRHQIRRHLKHIFHPIIGDSKHGEGRHNRFFQAHFGCTRLLLASVELTFPHPYTHDTTTVVAPLDAAFHHVIKQLGWQGSLPPRWLYTQQHSN